MAQSDGTAVSYISGRSQRLLDELVYALDRTPKAELTLWGKRAGIRFVNVGAQRVTLLGSLLANISRGTASEVSQAISAYLSGRSREHLEETGGRVNATFNRIKDSIQSSFNSVSNGLSADPKDAATRLFSFILGFYAGGGSGDGGIPDMDIDIGGIGWHRSIFTHSIIAGAVVETSVLSIIDLTQIVHRHLPEEHSEFWDELMRLSEMTGESFVTGASLGIASHLAVDTLIDGFTPYKDLPISLPEGIHKLLMGMNATAEGAYAIHRVSEKGSSDSVHTFSNQSQFKTNTENMMGNKLELTQERRESNEIEKLKALLKSEKPEQRFRTAKEFIQRYAGRNNIDVSGTIEAITTALRKLKAAHEPFRLGVLGEFRVGKSTLINAFLGQEAAFTDVLEATPAVCRFRFSRQNQATLVFRDGSKKTLSHQEMTDLLLEKLEEKQQRTPEDWSWFHSIEIIEYEVNSDRLRTFDIWDAPGLGGSEHNEAIANSFLERVGGALWVCDATLIGKASAVEPVKALVSAGKPVLCVINRIDEFQDDPQEAIEYVKQSFPGDFSDVMTISAIEALETQLEGGRSEAIEGLWERLLKVMGADEELGKTARIEKTIKTVGYDVARSIASLRRVVQDQLGLVDHFRYNFRETKNQLMAEIPKIISVETDNAFNELEREIWSQVKVAREQGVFESPVDQVISIINNEQTLTKINETVCNRSLESVGRSWSRFASEAITLSRAAVPLSVQGLPGLKVSRMRSFDKPMDQEAIDDGVFVGGMSSVIAGIIAASSVTVTWPIILAALPIGALVSWRKQQQIDGTNEGFVSQVHSLLSVMKEKFRQDLQQELVDALEDAVDEEIERRITEMTFDSVNDKDVVSLNEFKDILIVLESSFGEGQSLREQLDWSSEDVIQLLSNPGQRLDIVVSDNVEALSPILIHLPISTEVRVLVTTDREKSSNLDNHVSAMFGDWQGTKRVRITFPSSGSRFEELPTLLITAEECLVTDHSLRDFAERVARFKTYSHGRLAAQRLFASLWEGNSWSGDDVQTRPVR